MDFPPKGEFVSSNEEETMEIGEKFGCLLLPGSIVALKGKLGAGKTVFARGIAHALGVEERLLSPTYTIINEYKAKKCAFYHIDTYRLLGDEDFCLTGGADILYGGGVCIVEWPEKIKLPPETIWVTIEIMDDLKRRITIGKPR